MNSTVIPGLLYPDAEAAIAWLKQVLGFTEHAVYRNKDGIIHHAELTHGHGMIMLGTGELHPAAIKTHGINLILADPDVVYERAQAAGAAILFPLQDKPYGGRAFSCQDPAGYNWHVGSYNPWATT